MLPYAKFSQNKNRILRSAHPFPFHPGEHAHLPLLHLPFPLQLLGMQSAEVRVGKHYVSLGKQQASCNR